MAAKKNQTQTFHYYNYDSKNKMNPPQPPTLFVTTEKNMNNYWISFIVNVINSYDNNSRAVKER